MAMKSIEQQLKEALDRIAKLEKIVLVLQHSYTNHDKILRRLTSRIDQHDSKLDVITHSLRK